ncbi:hypothetical protein ACI3LY_005370 [Candidozyma auris]|uniref:Uncharacterized protein n=2 Tax=Candidozyma auris TaxID=498019 RepID=A0A8F2W3N7_CANAR|nr:hypothetical protein QG37_06919 [[Candida] auris]PIS50037.1 hypothetical protein CJI97_004724 [[Candida] auris]QWW25173.1 hypothetical protein CA7LBN_004055 [[Candida] auris]
MSKRGYGGFLRRYSSIKSKPISWLGGGSVAPATQDDLKRFLIEYQNLSSSQQDRITSQGIHPSYLANIKLINLLNSGDNISTFTHIAHNLTKKDGEILSSNLIERYIVKLISTGQLSPAVTLIHTMLESDKSSYGLSRQTWSFLASRACELGDHDAATLVYHEIIDPIEAYLDPAFNGLDNPHVPFLLFPDILASLAVIFMHNGNHVPVVGIQSYFKKFYSYFWHRTIYRTIALAKIESQAKAGLFSRALSDFVSLAWQHRGYRGLTKGSVVEHNLKYALDKNQKSRQEAILASNDPLNDSTIEYNKYTLPGKTFQSIFDGVISIADTPYFNELIRSKVKQVIAERSSVTERLVNFISSNHHGLTTPVVAALCSDGLVFEAWAVVNQARASFPRVHKKVFFRGGEVFVQMFKAIKAKFNTSEITASELRQLSELLQTCRNMCSETYDPGWSYECRLACLQALLACPSSLGQEIRLYLYEWISEHKSHSRLQKPLIALTKTDYEKLISINVGDTIISCVYPISEN